MAIESLGAAVTRHVGHTTRGHCLREWKVSVGRESVRAGGRDRELGQLKARVHADGVAQLLPEDALLAVVGQLEQVKAGGGGGQTATWLPLADGEEAPEDAAQGVPSVLQAHITASGWEVRGVGAWPTALVWPGL